ncbi:unnamed protein product [Caenorhabditis sp. 36 PRJEB53466]|nr:unnamed protein product [Caenorhabditis sp. 36 PRJEB53466]
MQTWILLASALLPVLLASYCGQSAIPYTFQVLRSGFPVLGCARPKCFGWTANGTRAGETAQFYRVAAKDDGYLRRSDQFIRNPSKNPNFVPQLAICTDEYKSNSCEEGEWVGGLSPQSDPFTDKLEIKCCSYQVLINSQDRGNAVVKQGQLVVGGEVLENEKLVAFDYISNLSKTVSKNGTVVYVATVKRMPCFDEEQTILDTKKQENTIVEAAAAVEQETTAVPTHQPSAPVPQTYQHAAPTINIQPYTAQNQQAAQGQGPYVNGNTNNVATNYGQFSQQAYGVAQNGQYSGYPQYSQQQAQQPQYSQQQAQQPQYYQDPFAAMFQQQQQALQQQALANQQQQQQQQQQQIAFVPLPPFPQQMIFPPAPQVPAAGVQPVVAAGVPQVPVAALPAVPIQITSTLPPMTLPKLEDLPKLQIPSVEDVEQVIPPVQRAILTSVAKFFGVL